VSIRRGLHPQPPTPTSIANGKKLAEANCVSCHGPKGKGDGPAVAAMPPFKHLPEKDRWDLVNYIRSLQK
jgi:mono/diheme cytochrome c family protein